MNFRTAKAKYLEAKAKYDSVLREVGEANAELNGLVEEGKISVEEWAEKTTDNEFSLGLDEAFGKLIDAEKELIKAGRVLLEPEMTGEQREQTEKVWNCKFVTVRDKLIDMLLKLEV